MAFTNLKFYRSLNRGVQIFEVKEKVESVTEEIPILK